MISRIGRLGHVCVRRGRVGKIRILRILGVSSGRKDQN